MTLEPRAQACWSRYLARLAPDDPARTARVEASPAGSPEITDRLLALYLAGRKPAGSSLLADFQAHGEALPQVGDHWIVLDSRGAPRLILRTARVEQHRFADIPEEVARAEGEGDSSVADWKRLHAGFFAPFLEQWGVASLEEATVITELFEEVHREPAAEDPRRSGASF